VNRMVWTNEIREGGGKTSRVLRDLMVPIILKDILYKTAVDISNVVWIAMSGNE